MSVALLLTGLGLLLGLSLACTRAEPTTALTTTPRPTLQPEATPTPRDTGTPGPTPGPTSADVPTLAPLLSPTPDPTEPAAPAPTSTVIPTHVPTATESPNHTRVPASTVLPTPTVESCRASYETQVVSGPSGPEPPHDGDRVFRSLTVDPNDAAIVVLGTERNGFVRSLDGGQTWTRHREGFRSDDIGYPEVWDIDISPSDPDVLMAATLDSPGPPTGPRGQPGLYRSTDGGESWMQLNCGFTTSRVVSVRIDPSNPDVAVAGLEGGFPSYTGDSNFYPGGIFRTEDGGRNWTRVELGPDDERNGYSIMRTVPTDPPTIITFGMDFADLSKNLGFLRSTDMGRIWEFFASEFRNRFIDNFDVSSDGRVIYANERDTYFGWISRDSGPIAVSPVNPNLVLFASFDDVRRSTNGLETVQVVMDAPSTVREIVFAPSAPNIVYAETDGYLLYRSDDAGLTWRLLANIRDDVLNVQP